MNEILPLDSSLPWLWIIEYLAGFKQVDTNILNDLIERAPDLPGDPGKNARERVALRCLEELFDPIVRLAGGVIPASRVCFDLSQSCEDVLQCILQESSVSDLMSPRPELLKWDLYPFIMHKRATLPKCALEELKDTILSGNHPYAAALKEISGSVSTNEPDGVTVCDDHHNALTTRLCESSSNTQTVPAKSNVVPLILENGNRILQHDLCLKNLLSSKRVRSELAAEDLADVNNGYKDSLFGHNGLHLNAKKLKQGCQSSAYTNPSVGQTSNALLLEDACGRFRVAEVDCSALCKECQVGEHCNDDNIENCHDTNNICEIGDGSVQFVTVDETQNSGPLSGAPLMKTQQQISVEEAYGKDGQSSNSKLRPLHIVSTDGIAQNGSNPCEARADVYHPCDDEMLSNYDEFCEEGIDMAMKKSPFLSSQCTSSQYMLGTAGWSKQNLCVKCNKDGQMLLCSTSGCPLVVHESCLGSQARFDDKGNFHCPFCVYSLSISEYLEAKKKDHLARKKLSAFVHVFEHCSMKHSEGRRKEQNPTNRNGEDANCQFQRGLVNKQQSGPSMSFRDVNTPCMGDEANLLKIQESGNLKEKELSTRQNRQDLNHQCQSCVADKRQPGSSTLCRDISTQSMEDEANCIRMQENGHLEEREQTTRSQNRIFDCQFQRNLADEQQAGPSISRIVVNKPCMENESNFCSGTVCIATIGKEGKEKVVKENLSKREPEKQGAQLSDSPDYNISNASSENTETTHVVNHREDEERIQKGVLQQHITNPDQQPLVLDFDGEDTSDTESEDFLSLTSISRRDVNTPCIEDETNVNSRTLCIPTLAKESKEEVVKESLSEREPERQGAQPLSDGPDYNSDNPSSQNTETAHLNQRQAEAGILGIPKQIPKEVLWQHRTNPDQQPIVLNFDGEDTSDSENDEGIKLNYSIRFRRQQRKCTYLAVPQLRRKKVPWTIEEEQMLREGVSKFSSKAGGNIPWKEILDLGSSVFLNCRTSVDLKDKWRNMCKGSPKPKAEMKSSHTGGGIVQTAGGLKMSIS